MKNDIGDSKEFLNILEKNKYYDIETPYGYGGILTDNILTEDTKENFLKTFTKYCNDNNIISQFVRFHPLLNNYINFDKIVTQRYMRDTIYIDTTSKDIIIANMDSKNRNMVRKAIKNGITIKIKPITEYKDFLDMYIETMAKNNADDYYTFNEDYFKSLISMSNNACIFYAYLNNIPISASIMYYNDQFMHYHLSGSHFEYRKYSPSNLLLYEAACWASEKGIRKFHLGGGMNPDDSLFGFKKQFNKNGRLPFYIGRTIFNKNSYEKLLELRKNNNHDFDINNSFMIQYRKP